MTSGLYDSEDLRYMPDREAALRRRGSRFASAMTIVTFLCLVCLLTWAHFAVLDEVRRVVKRSQRSQDGHLTGDGLLDGPCSALGIVRKGVS